MPYDSHFFYDSYDFSYNFPFVCIRKNYINPLFGSPNKGRVKSLNFELLSSITHFLPTSKSSSAGWRFQENKCLFPLAEGLRICNAIFNKKRKSKRQPPAIPHQRKAENYYPLSFLFVFSENFLANESAPWLIKGLFQYKFEETRVKKTRPRPNNNNNKRKKKH